MINIRNYIKRNWVRVLALAVALMAVPLCGCSGDETVEEAPLVLPTPEPDPQPASGGGLILPMPENADISDPYLVNTEEMLSLYSMVYEGLLRIDSTGQLTALLAETWSVDDAGYTWTLTLRTARWHNSDTRLTASDVVYSFERLSAMETSYYSTIIEDIESISTVDNYTISVKMKHKGVSALYSLIFPILPAGSSDGLPAGTGPYIIEHASSERISLSANEDWWRQRAYIDTVIFLARDNTETALASYEAGQLNMVPTSLVSAGRYRSEGVTNVLDIMTQTCEMIMINDSAELLKNVKVRKAIAYALDRSAIITAAYMNRAQASDVPIAPDSWLYDSTSKVYDYNLVTAQTLLTEVGWSDIDGDGKLEREGRDYDELSLTLLVSSSSDTARQSAAQLIASQLGEIGITVDVVSAAFSIGDESSEYVSMLKSGSFDIALIGVNMGRDCDLSAIVNRDGERNYGRFTNAYLETLVQTVNTAADEESFKLAAAELQQALISDMPFITLYFRQNSIVYSAEIQGLTDVREPDIFRTISKWYINVE